MIELWAWIKVGIGPFLKLVSYAQRKSRKKPFEVAWSAAVERYLDGPLAPKYSFLSSSAVKFIVARKLRPGAADISIDDLLDDGDVAPEADKGAFLEILIFELKKRC